jgi:hypothetical protein
MSNMIGGDPTAEWLTAHSEMGAAKTTEAPDDSSDQTGDEPTSVPRGQLVGSQPKVADPPSDNDRIWVDLVQNLPGQASMSGDRSCGSPDQLLARPRST